MVEFRPLTQREVKQRFQPTKTYLEEYCRNGHRRTPENTRRVISHGYQIKECRLCLNEASNRRFHRDNPYSEYRGSYGIRTGTKNAQGNRNKA